MKYILLTALVYIVYRFVNPPNQISKPQEDSSDFVDYEEIE